MPKKITIILDDDLHKRLVLATLDAAPVRRDGVRSRSSLQKIFVEAAELYLEKGIPKKDSSDLANMVRIAKTKRHQLSRELPRVIDSICKESLQSLGSTLAERLSVYFVGALEGKASVAKSSRDASKRPSRPTAEELRDFKTRIRGVRERVHGIGTRIESDEEKNSPSREGAA